MKILGIDPGLGRMGWAVIERVGGKITPLGMGLIETPMIALPDRLAIIGGEIKRLITVYEPDRLATERQIFAANRTTAFDVAKAMGVVLYLASHQNLSITEYLPSEIKQSISGYGAADKKQISYMATRLAGLTAPPKPDDVADALAIALTDGLRFRPMETIVKPKK